MNLNFHGDLLIVNEYNTISSTLESILKRYRDPSGNVDYFSMMGDASIVSFAESLADFDLESIQSRDERLAFWINCYNALSIYGVIEKLKEDPGFAERGNSSWFQRVRFFALQKFNVGGRTMTLRSIENMIREDFGDPRIHFALNCSSMGCPILKDGRYSAENLDSELDAATKLYLGSPQGAILDIQKGVLSLSMIFKWYRKDFEMTEKSIPEYVAQFLPDDQRRYIMENLTSIKIKYLDYDWSLNASDEVE